MQRTTVSLNDDFLRDLRLMAAERRMSIAALVREAVEEKFATFRRRPHSLGIRSSGHADTARRAGEERPEQRSWR